MVFTNGFQCVCICVSVFITLITLGVGSVLHDRLVHLLVITDMPHPPLQLIYIYLIMLAVALLLQAVLGILLMVGGFKFKQLVEEMDDNERGNARVKLEIETVSSPAVQVHLPDNNKALQQVKHLLTLPGRDRQASLRSLHAYDPVNSSPSLYAVPLTPFDAETGTWPVSDDQMFSIQSPQDTDGQVFRLQSPEENARCYNNFTSQSYFTRNILDYNSSMKQVCRLIP